MELNKIKKESVSVIFAKIALGFCFLTSFIMVAIVLFYAITKKNEAVQNSLALRQIESIELSQDKKAVLNSETKEVIFTIEEAINDSQVQMYHEQERFQNKTKKYMGDCFEEAVLSNNGRFIVFLTGCLYQNSSQAWIGVYRRHFTCDFHTTWQCDPNDPTAPGQEGFNEFRIFSSFLIGGSGRNFVWSENDKTITYEADLDLSGLTETRTINSITGKIIDSKINSENEIDMANWKTYNTQSSNLNLYKNLDNPFTFKYPANWFLVETKGGIDIYSFQPTIGYGVGTLQKGQFKAEIWLLDYPNNINNLSILEWCDEKLNSYDSSHNKRIFLRRERIINDFNIAEIEFELDGWENINGKFICIEGKRNNMIMLGHPLSSEHMKTFNQILPSFKFIEKDEKTFSCGISTVQDIDGNIYNTVQIGEQCWMKENLKVTKNPQGEKITRYCYDNNKNICETDGGLYNWNTTMNGSTEEGAQGICPNGWHMPRDSEWHEIESSLTMGDCDVDRSVLNHSEWGCDVAGTKLKSGGSSGFEGLFAGYRNPNGSFAVRGANAIFWSSTENGYSAWYRNLHQERSTIRRDAYGKTESYSVRCLKD